MKQLINYEWKGSQRHNIQRCWFRIPYHEACLLCYYNNYFALRAITSTCFLIFSQIFSPLRVCALANTTLTEKHFPKAFRSMVKSVHREFPMEHDLLFVTLCLLYFSSFQKAILETKKTKLDGWWSVDLFLSDVDFEFKLFRVSEGSEKLFSPRGCWTINKWS